MMEMSIKILLSIGFLFLTVNAFAQGSGSSESAKSKGGAARKNNFAVTRSVSGSVTSIKNGSLIVKGKNGKSVSLRVTAKTHGGDCLRIGRRVKVIYTPGSGVASLVRCR